MKRIIFIPVLLIIAVSLIGCGGTTNAANGTPRPPATSADYPSKIPSSDDPRNAPISDSSPIDRPEGTSGLPTYGEVAGTYVKDKGGKIILDDQGNFQQWIGNGTEVDFFGTYSFGNMERYGLGIKLDDPRYPKGGSVCYWSGDELVLSGGHYKKR